jgi:Flp pilus assembly protein TadG
VTTVEFSLVLPVFLTIAFATIEGGRFVTARMMLSYAVTVGARAATLKSASATSVATAVQNAAPMLHLSQSQVEISAALPATVGSTVTVSIGVSNAANKYTFTSLIPSTVFSTRSWSAQATAIVR